MTVYKRFIYYLIMVVASSFAYAEENKPSTIEILLNDIKKVETELKAKDLSISRLGKLNKDLTTLKANAANCISEYEKNVVDKKTALETLGEKHKKESPELIKQRKQQEKDLTEAETGLATCNAAALRVQDAIESVDVKLQKQLEEQLLSQGKNIFQVIAQHRDLPSDWYKQAVSKNKKHIWVLNAREHQIWTLFGIIILSMAVGVLVRYFATPALVRVHWSPEPSGRFAASLLGSFCQDAPYLLGSFALLITMLVYTADMTPAPLITSIANGLCFFFAARYVIHFSLAPPAPGSLFLDIPLNVARALARRLKILAVIMLFSYLLVDTIIGASVPEYAMSLGRSVLRIAFAINLIWVLWLFKDLRGFLSHSWLRFGLSLVLVVALLADLSGYTNLSDWLLRSVFGSLFVILTILILSSLSSDLLEGLEYGHTSWQRRLRRILGFTPEGHITGFFWFRLLVNLGWWSLLILSLIIIWDLSASVVEEVRVIFTQGFEIGSLKVVPARIVFALVSLGVLVALSAWFQGQMRKRLVSKMPMERGAREAMVTMIGYIGVAVAILITLGISGIDYANLAIIAGALSLGIGFGLQNIVNNFVSGLILLFERPIKTGDWVVVGNTEGHVKSIRIRATQIQTFDRADVIVPNSELISGQVTNWMLRDPRGRIRVPVGVAYGSDTQKVKDILLKVANEHPDVIVNDSAPAPKVLFRQFGDSSLNFELRCYIKHVDDRINIISDMNFAIDAAFRENQIEIPFPQRDLHIKNGLSDKPDTSG